MRTIPPFLNPHTPFLRYPLCMKLPVPLMLLLALLLPACSLAPPETKQEKSALAQAGKPYALPVEKRTLPELPAEPTAQDVLTRAFLANGDLESAYFEWQAAVQRIDM